MRPFAALSLVLVSAAVLAQHSAPQSEARSRICLNGEWQFSPADRDLSFPPSQEWDQTPIRIPSPWNVNSFSRGDGGDFECFPSYPSSWEPVTAAWHRRTLFIPQSMRGKALFLRFEAVAYWADVYLNGAKVGSHEGAFTPFEFDVTAHARIGQDNELLVGVKARRFFNVKGRTAYGWGSFWGEHINGIWQDVWLIARPKLHVSDVFIITDVAKRQLSLQVSITNLTPRSQRVRLHNHLFNAADAAPGAVPVKGLRRVRATVQAGATRTIELSEPWASPHLWWPHDPHLYVCLTRLYAEQEGGPLLDAKRTRFGFRQFTVGADGKKFRLNGVPFSGRGDAWHFMGIPQLTPAFARAWYDMARSCNVNIIRLHAQVYPEYYLDMADEMGMLIVDETALWGSAINFWYDEDFLRRARDHCRELVLRDRNHPSVVLYSVANEIYARKSDDNAPSLDWIFARYAELARYMRTLDPTREVSSDGDGDLNGRLSIYSLHYPGAADPKKNKICTIGEAGSMYYSTPPEVAHAIGDRAYLTANDRMDAVALETADLIEGYRKWAAYSTPFNVAWYGLEPLKTDVHFAYEDLEAPGVKPERLGPYCATLNAGRDSRLPRFIPNPLYHAVKDAFEPIRFFIAERGQMVWADSPVTRHLTIHNDVLSPSELKLSWRLVSRGKVLQSAAQQMTLQPGDMTQRQIDFMAPDASDKPGLTRVQLQVRLSRNRELCYYRAVDLDVAPRHWPSCPEDVWGGGGGTAQNALELPTALYDPSGQTAEVLTWLGVPFDTAPTVQALIDSPTEIRIVGAQSGLSAEDALRVDGGSPYLVVFEGNPSFYGERLYCDRVSGVCRRGFLAGDALGPSGHRPADYRGIEDAHLKFWGENGAVAHYACGRTVHGNVRPLVRSGNGDALMSMAFSGVRPRVLCELAAITKAREEPAAAVMARLAVLAVTRKPPSLPAPCRVAARRGSRFAAAMDMLRIETIPRPPSVLLCDASAEPIDPDLVRRFARRKMSLRKASQDFLVLVGLEPETLEAWNAVLPFELDLQRTDAPQLIRAPAAGGLVNNIHHRDLFGIRKESTTPVMAWAVFCPDPSARPLLSTNHTDWRRWCWRPENMKTGAIIRSEREPFSPQTGLLALGGAPVTVLVCQVRLDPMTPQSMRFYSQLLTNLGVPMRPGKAQNVDMTPFNVDQDGFIKAWLLCGPFDGADVHGRDLLGGEAQARPEPGAVSGERIWGVYRSAGPVIDFAAKDMFGERQDCAIYAGTWVRSSSDMVASLWLGSDDGAKAWLNGEPIHDNPTVRPVTRDSDKIDGLQLKAGWNFLLCKVSQGAGKWGLCTRFVDAHGRPLQGIGIDPMGPARSREPVARDGWQVQADPAAEGAANAIDGDPATRWSTGEPQRPGMWFTVDLGGQKTVSQIVLDATDSPGDYPRGLTVQVSADGKQFTTVAQCPNTTAAQQAGKLALIIPPTALRYVKITQTAPGGTSGGLWWSIHELGLFH